MAHPLKFSLRRVSPVLMFSTLCLPLASAQVQSASLAQTNASERTLRLQPTARPGHAKQLWIALRNILPAPATFDLDQSEAAIVAHGTPEQLQLAQKIVDDAEATHTQAASEASPTHTQIAVRPDPNHVVAQTLYLPATLSIADEKKLGAALRAGASPEVKVYVLEQEHAVVLYTTADQLTIAKAKITEMVPGWTATHQNEATAFQEEQPTTGKADVLEQALYLPASLDARGGVEMLVALRNTLDPQAKLYLVPSSNVLVLSATATNLRLARKLISDLTGERPSV